MSELPMATDTTKYTEGQLLVLLRNKLNKTGNGGAGEYAVLGGVRNGAGFDSNRTFDAVAVSLWPSRGLAIHIYEIKVSRSDWQRELANPAKADDACRIADHFSIIAPAGVVRGGELPSEWGLLEVVGQGDNLSLRTKVQAPRLHPERNRSTPVDRGFLVALLRSCPGAVPGGKVPPATKEELDDAYARGRKDAEQHRRHSLEIAQARVASFERDISEVKEALVAAGLDSWAADLHSLARNAPAIAAAVQDAQAGERLDQARSALRRALEALGG